MSDKNDFNQHENIEFTSHPSFQKIMKRSKRKQTLKYIFITILTTTILLVILFSGSQYILNKRVENQRELYDSIQGANISYGSTDYNYNLFSVITNTTYRKMIGDRSIVWDKVTKKIPLIGRIKTVSTGSGMIELDTFNKEAHRYVRYNDYNNERRIDFYYPKLSYEYLPHELDIATTLGKNKLVEVALSFKKPMTLDDLKNKLGNENVNWLWVDTTTEVQMKRMEDSLDKDNLKVKGGGGAFGFHVSPTTPYSNQSGIYFVSLLKQLSKTDSHKKTIKSVLKSIKENTKLTNGNILINGAVVSGTPDELKRFQKLDIIRCSVIGATIDKY